MSSRPTSDTEMQGKPLPHIFPYSIGFWDGTKQRELRIQKCTHCGHMQMYPRTNCENCGMRDLSWAKTKGTGTVYTYTIIRQVVGNSPAFEREIPFALCIIELDEGVRIVAQVMNCPPEQIKIGMHVESFFEDIGNGVTIVKFGPAR